MGLIHGKWIVMLWLFIRFDKDISDNRYVYH